jgi:hypothetical protein
MFKIPKEDDSEDEMDNEDVDDQFEISKQVLLALHVEMCCLLFPSIKGIFAVGMKAENALVACKEARYFRKDDRATNYFPHLAFFARKKALKSYIKYGLSMAKQSYPVASATELSSQLNQTTTAPQATIAALLRILVHGYIISVGEMKLTGTLCLLTLDETFDE